MKETLSAISKRIGVSASTISRVMSGKAEKYRISDETVARVMAEVKRCNYYPSAIAQGLRTNKTHTIGIVIPSVSNPYFADMADAIMSAATAKGYSAMIVDTMEDEGNQNSSISMLMSRKVDGIIAAPCGHDSSIFDEISKIIPVVFVDRYFDNSKIPYVTANNFRGAYEAVQHLIHNGHKQIACIQGDIDSLPNKRRVAGYKQALQKNGLIDNELIVGDSFSIQNGYLETKLLINRDKRPTAIFALSYTILLGVIKAIQDNGLKIPEDISLISFDDNLSLDYITPAITRVSQPVEEMGKLSAKLLFEQIEEKNTPLTQLELSSNIIMRSSVRNMYGGS